MAFTEALFVQVLISIQSLILVPEPYYNEPGYDKNYGTSSGNCNHTTQGPRTELSLIYATSGTRESNQYNEQVFRNNMRHAILEQLKSPPEGFSNVVKSHFFYKRESLIKVTYYYIG